MNTFGMMAGYLSMITGHQMSQPLTLVVSCSVRMAHGQRKTVQYRIISSANKLMVNNV